MTYDEKVRWLRRYRQALRAEDRRRDQISAVRARMESTSQALRPVVGGGSGGGNAIERGVELLDRYQRDLVEQLEKSQKIRAETLEQARAEVADTHRKELDSALKAQAERMSADHAEALRRNTETTRREVQEAADQRTAKLVEQAAETARREQAEKDSAALEQARQTAQKLQLSASEESIRFSVLFEQLQNAAQEMMDLMDALTAEGRTEEADRLRKALTGALQALTGQMNEENKHNEKSV